MSQDSEFWKDVSDDDLKDMWKQFAGTGEAEMSFPDFNEFLTPSSQDNQLMYEPMSTDGQPSSVPTPTPILRGQEDQQKAALTAYQVAQAAISQDQAKARMVIEQVHQLRSVQDQQLDHIRQIQQQLLLSAIQPKDALRQLLDQQRKLLAQIEMELKELQQLHRSVLLDPPALHQLRLLLQHLKLQQQKIELLKQEISIVLNAVNLATSSSSVSTPATTTSITTNNPISGVPPPSPITSTSPPTPHPTILPPICVAALAITDQPVPQVLFKNKTLEEAYVLILLTGSNVNIQNISKVKAVLVADEPTWKTKKPIENDLQSMEAMKRITYFHNIKFNVSTRMSMVYLKFVVQVQLAGGQGTHTIESPGSSPIIVITNESQWCDAAGKLLLFEAFGENNDITWQHLANITHTHFLKATRQEAGSPSRRLNRGEFQYLHYKFFGGQLMVTQQQAGRFWSWFGQVIQSLRFKRHISSLWFTGLIYGFITKSTCNELLRDEMVGTFLIRFSEHYPGLFAIAYVDGEPGERVKHYLVQPEDISSNKSLPDFLREKSQFLYIKQLDPQTGELRTFDKHQVLQDYYSKRQRDQPRSGYVLLF